MTKLKHGIAIKSDALLATDMRGVISMAYIQEELNFNPYRLVDVTIFKSDGWNEYQSPATILVYKDNYDYDTMGKESWFLCMSELEYSKDKNKIINLSYCI